MYKIYLKNARKNVLFRDSTVETFSNAIADGGTGVFRIIFNTFATRETGNSHSGRSSAGPAPNRIRYLYVYVSGPRPNRSGTVAGKKKKKLKTSIFTVRPKTIYLSRGGGSRDDRVRDNWLCPRRSKRRFEKSTRTSIVRDRCRRRCRSLPIVAAVVAVEAGK